MLSLHHIILTLFFVGMLSACGDSELLHSTFHLPTSISEDEVSLGSIDDSIKSSHTAYKGIVGLVDVIFEDASTQSKYIMCSTFRMYHLSKKHDKNSSFFRTFQKVMKKQSLVSIKSDPDQHAFLMVPMAKKYAGLNPWTMNLQPLMAEKADVESACDEPFHRAIPNSLKACDTEKRTLAKYTVLAIQRLESLKKTLLAMEELASVYTGFETALMKIKNDEKEGLKNPRAVTEKIKAYNTFLKSSRNQLPSMSEHMPIESSLADKEVSSLLKVFL